VTNAAFRFINRAMCGLFLLAVVVQWNDPDPWRWMVMYGAAATVCLLVALRRHIGTAAPLAVGATALVWSVSTIAGGPAAAQYAQMFDAWEMKAMPVEEAREASGLLIIAAWMVVVAAAQRRARTRAA
jgi:hypothetical protein